MSRTSFIIVFFLALYKVSLTHTLQLVEVLAKAGAVETVDPEFYIGSSGMDYRELCVLGYVWRLGTNKRSAFDAETNSIASSVAHWCVFRCVFLPPTLLSFGESDTHSFVRRRVAADYAVVLDASLSAVIMQKLLLLQNVESDAAAYGLAARAETMNLDPCVVRVRRFFDWLSRPCAAHFASAEHWSRECGVRDEFVRAVQRNGSYADVRTLSASATRAVGADEDSFEAFLTALGRLENAGISSDIVHALEESIVPPRFVLDVLEHVADASRGSPDEYTALVSVLERYESSRRRKRRVSAEKDDRVGRVRLRLVRGLGASILGV